MSYCSICGSKIRESEASSDEQLVSVHADCFLRQHVESLVNQGFENATEKKEP